MYIDRVGPDQTVRNTSGIMDFLLRCALLFYLFVVVVVSCVCVCVYVCVCVCVCCCCCCCCCFMRVLRRFQ